MALLSRASAAHSNSRCYAEQFSRIFFPELYPWRLSFGLATWKWKGEAVDHRLFLCGWLVLRGHLWISFPEGDFAYGEGWPAEDVSVSRCIAGVGWAPSTVVSQKVVWLCFGFQTRPWRLVVSTYSASVRGESVLHVNLCVQFYVCNAGCTNW